MPHINVAENVAEPCRTPISPLAQPSRRSSLRPAKRPSIQTRPSRPTPTRAAFAWAESRKSYCDLLGIDEEHMISVLVRAGKLPRDPIDAMERPGAAVKWTKDKIFDIFPDGVHRATDLAREIGMSYEAMTSRLQHLINEGRVTRVVRGKFARTDWLEAERERQSEAAWARKAKELDDLIAPEHPPATSIHEALRDGAKTLREIGWAMDLDATTIYERLNRALDQGSVVKDGALWRLST